MADVARRAGLTLEQGRRFVQAVLDELELGREVRLENLGTFRVSEIAPRTVRSSVLPEGSVKVPRRKVLRFSRAAGAARQLNDGGR